MKIEIAKNSGFCFGVKRAVNMAIAVRQERAETVYTLGELIHNETVVAELTAKGIIPVEDLDKLKPFDTLIIRSHGAHKRIYELCKSRGISIIDATCPYVERIHNIVEKEYAQGAKIIVTGKADHPEVIGINGFCGDSAAVISTPEEAKALKIDGRAALVSQTTFDVQNFGKIKEAFNDNVITYNTICDTTQKRQDEAAQMSKRADLMLVIGGKNSSNTQKLANLCHKYCSCVKTIENPCKVTLEMCLTNGIIGIVAGASTPDWMIREVTTRMNELDKTAQLNETKGETEAAVNASAAETVKPVDTNAAQKPAAEKNTADGIKKEADSAKKAEPKAQKETDKSESEPNFADAFEKTLVKIRNGQVLTGKVVQIVDNEVCVNIGYKSDGFIPKAEFSDNPELDPNTLYKIGDEIEVEVLKVNDGEGNVLLSRKNVEGKRLWEVLANDEDLKSKTFDAMGKQAIKGGLLATINGVEAFVPASMLSTRFVPDMSIFVGKPLKLRIIEVDKSKRRIIASHKSIMLEERIAEKKAILDGLKVGEKHMGKVKRLVDFGAFVDIGGIEGMVHASDLARHRIKHPSEVVSLNQEIEVIILGLDREKGRISLGYKQLQPSPWVTAKEKYKAGDIIEGKVIRIVPFGAFVSLDPDIDGLIHISRLGVRHVNAVEDEVKVGEMVRVKITEVDADAKRISLSRRDALLEEHPEIAEELKREREELEAKRLKERQERLEQRSTEEKKKEERTRRDSIRAQARTGLVSDQKKGQGQRGDRPAKPQQSTDRPARPQGDASRRSEPRHDRPQERYSRRFSEDGEYELPPVESATTSLASLLQNFTAIDDNTTESDE